MVRDCLEKRFEIKTQVISALDGKDKSVKGTASPSGPAPTMKNREPSAEGTEGRLPNRVVRCTAQGWEVELDQRHADLTVQELGLHDSNSVITPGENEPRRKEGDNE